jgi:hypothetical protein
MSQNEEQFVETVDVRDVKQLRSPIIRFFASRFADQLTLELRKRQLLATGRWKLIRAVPRSEGSEEASTQVFDLYGTPASSPRSSGPSRRVPRSGLVPWTGPRRRW